MNQFSDVLIEKIEKKLNSSKIITKKHCWEKWVFFSKTKQDYPVSVSIPFDRYTIDENLEIDLISLEGYWNEKDSSGQHIWTISTTVRYRGVEIINYEAPIFQAQSSYELSKKIESALITNHSRIQEEFRKKLLNEKLI